MVLTFVSFCPPPPCPPQDDVLQPTVASQEEVGVEPGGEGPQRRRSKKQHRERGTSDAGGSRERGTSDAGGSRRKKKHKSRHSTKEGEENHTH